MSTRLLAALLTVLLAVTTTAVTDDASAQERPLGAEDEDEDGDDDTAPPRVPSVDEIDAARAVEADPQGRLIELTIGLYEAAAAYNGTCDKMWRPIRDYLDDHAGDIESAANLIAARARNMSPEQLTALGEVFAAGLIGHPTVRAGQDALYHCLRSADVQGKGRPLEKEMRRFFRLQKSMIDTIIGPVD